jgi:hypothetical protein
MDIQLHPETKKLLSQIDDFKQQISDLIERESLLRTRTLPLLNAIYEKEIGAHEFDLLKIRIEINELKFRIERLMAILNRGDKFDPKDLALLEVEIREVKKQWQKEIDDKEQLLNASISLLNTVTFLTKDEQNKLKHLFRKLCMSLHPDLNKNFDAYQLYWENVQSAYSCGDIKTLEALLVAVQKYEGVSDHDVGSSLEILRKERDRLESLVLEHSQRLHDAQQNPPFCIEKELHDAVWIESKQTELKESYEAMKSRCGELQGIYDEIINQSDVKVQ